MANATLTSRIEEYLEKQRIVVADDAYFGIADHIASAVKGITDPGKIRRTVEGACADLERGELLDEDSGIEQDITNIVVNG